MSAVSKEVTETPRTDAMSQEIELQDATYHNAYERARGLCYELELALAEALAWTDEDKPLPEDEAIEAAHPLKTKDFRTHAEAMRLVGAKRSKGALVDLVNWLLRSISEEQRDAARWRKFCGLMAFGDFIVLDFRHNNELPPLDVDYIHQLTAALDAGSDLHAKAGYEDDARCVGKAPK